MKEKKSTGYLLMVIMYILSSLIGVFAMRDADIELKHLLKFIGRGFIFWFILEVLILIGGIVLNKKFNQKIDSEESQKFTIPYFIFNIGTLIAMVMSMEGSTKILGIIVGAFLFNILPVILTFSIMSSDYDIYSIGTQNKQKSKESYIKTNDIYDKFGNKIGSSSTYNDGLSGIEKTYVKDNLGNTIAESTSIDGHTKTKVNTTRRF